MNMTTLIIASVGVLGMIGMLVTYRLWLRVFGIVLVPEDSIGVVNKKFVLFGQYKTLPDGAIVALRGEAGMQADTLAPGVHFWLWPWQFEIKPVQFVTIEEGTIGVVEARDGHPLSGGRVLAKAVECDAFQNARAFIEHGGERGPQIGIIPPGTYRINTNLFQIGVAKAIDIDDNMVGIVTTKEGQPLQAGDIAGPTIPNHNLFQNGQAFVTNGGYKGLQEQVMLAGRYFINPLFAAVELKEMTSVPIANVGVVIAYVGADGVDVTGETFRHGNLVNRGQKGVWVDPLDPGKYPINTYTHKVELVPTANVVLNWATGKTESHMLDKNLSTITVRSSDGFTFNLDVSQIIHIPRNDAPKVIARFGSMANLVTQVLEPTIGNYFRNAAQNSDVIDFLKSRRERQTDAKDAIVKALSYYNVGAVDTLIGDINPPPELMKTLTDRKLAEQERVTFGTQQAAEETRKALEQARAIADTQAQVVGAERQVEIQDFQARAKVKTAEGDASSRRLNAEAEAAAVQVTGAAEAGRTLAIGEAEAKVIEQKIASMESGNFASVEVAKSLSGSGMKLVPDIVVSSGNGAGDPASSLISVLLANLVRNGHAPTDK